MSFIFIASIFVLIAILLNRVPQDNWTTPLYWSYYITVGAASLFGTLGIVTVLFKQGDKYMIDANYFLILFGVLAVMAGILTLLLIILAGILK